MGSICYLLCLVSQMTSWRGYTQNESALACNKHVDRIASTHRTPVP